MDSWQYVEDSEFRPNTVMTSMDRQTVDKIMQLVGPMVKQLVREEVQDYYDRQLSDFESRLSELEENFRDLEALVRGSKGSKQNGPRSTLESSRPKVEKDRTDVKVELTQTQASHRAQGVGTRFTDLEATYHDLHVQIGGLDKDNSSLLSTITTRRSETDRRPRASEQHPSYGRPSSFTCDRKTPSPINLAPYVEQMSPLFNAPHSRQPTSSSRLPKDEVIDRSFGSVTKKHQRFLSNVEISYKPVTKLSGIGKAYGEKLERAGYGTAEAVLQKYRALGGDELRFKAWLNETCRANSLDQDRCYQCLRQWDSQY